MNRLAIWVVGEPGAGKTHLVRQLLGQRPACLVDGKVKWTVSAYDSMVAAGTYVGQPFDGADTVPYDGAKACLEFWRDAFPDKRVTIFDGDRFSNLGVVEWVRQQVPDVECWVVLLETPPEVAQARRVARGSAQNATWVKGRATKAVRFYDAATALPGVDGLRHPGLDAGWVLALITKRLGREKSSSD